MYVIKHAAIADDHWVDAGGRTLAALDEFLSERHGRTIRTEELVVLDSVEHLRRVMFRPPPVPPRVRPARGISRLFALALLQHGLAVALVMPGLLFT